MSKDPELNVWRFDVDLFGLPDPRYGSHEVVLEFNTPIDACVAGTNSNSPLHCTFYTDSNGLEMQKRVSNYRPTWDIQMNYNRSNDNITANFYPINSAISIENDNLRFTVMNDRSQAGASLDRGNIQLMQNRRVFADDHKGMDEYLNEQDVYGNGIRVKATYNVELA